MATLWPIEDGRDCVVPSVGRSAAVPPIGKRPALGDPPFFDPMDPQDTDVFVYDWSPVAFPGDTIVAASVTCDPPLITIGTPTILGNTVQVFIGPATGSAATYDFNCSATFASGRVLDWGVELDVRPL